MTDCVFCSIVAGEAPAATVSETEHTVAFLDANPLAPGHTLVVPRTHAEILEELAPETGHAIMDELRRLAPAIEDAVDADATTIGFNNGPAAGQEIPHVHGHVIPRERGDGGGPIHAVLPRQPATGDDPESIAAAIARRL
jgi:histidine triad (HIT) family protein